MEKVKSLTGNTSSLLPPFLTDDQGIKQHGYQNISNLLARTFANNSSFKNYDVNSLPFSNQNISDIQDSLCQVFFNNDDDFNKPFLIEELLPVLQNITNSSPGPDDIPYSFLKNLPEIGIQHLLHIFNTIWISQSFLINGLNLLFFLFLNKIKIIRILQILDQFL